VIAAGTDIPGVAMMEPMPPRNLHPSWPPAVVEGVADVLTSTGWPGLTNSEITKLLAMLGIADVEAPNKRTRLWAALRNQQLRDGASNCVIRFITEAMAPGRHLRDQSRFEALRDGLAEPLSLVGDRDWCARPGGPRPREGGATACGSAPSRTTPRAGHVPPGGRHRGGPVRAAQLGSRRRRPGVTPAAALSRAPA
jgi:hypothetical protein